MQTDTQRGNTHPEAYSKKEQHKKIVRDTYPLRSQPRNMHFIVSIFSALEADMRVRERKPTGMSECTTSLQGTDSEFMHYTLDWRRASWAHHRSSFDNVDATTRREPGHESSIQHETCNFVMKIHYRVEFTEKRTKFRNEQQSDGELQIFAFRVTEHRLYKYWLEIFRKQPRSSKTASILQGSDRFEVSSKTRTCNVHPLCSSLKGSAPFIDWLNYRLSSRVTQSSCVSLAAAVRNGLRRQPMCNPF